MQQETFRQAAHQLVDWIADYYEQLPQRPVTPDVQPGEIQAQLPDQAPLQGEDFERIFQDFEKLILPGMTHWQHPGFMGYFPANASRPSFLGEMLCSALGAQCMSWVTSPAATELEAQMMLWLREALGLPGHWQGVIQDTASTATLCALLSARERAAQINQKGFQGERFRIYASAEAHSSIEKAVRIAGFGSENLVKIDLDQDFALDPQALQGAIQKDLEQGYQPLCVVAAWGTTGSTALDPIPEIAKICGQYQLWLHVDAAYAGSALILPEFQALIGDLSGVDSFVFNPHKWLLTHFDCSAYFVRDVQALTHTFGLTPEYLKTEQDRQVNNYRDWGIQLGRRFRALKLWFVLRSYGLEGLQLILRQQIAWTQELVQAIVQHPEYELLAPAPLNLICFRYAPQGYSEEALEQLNPKLLQAVNQTGRYFITHTRLNKRYSLRIVLGQQQSQRQDLFALWQLIQELAEGLKGASDA